MSTVILTSSDTFRTAYLAKMVYPDHFNGRDRRFRVGETETYMIAEGETVLDIKADRIVILDNGSFRDLPAWKDILSARLARGGRMITVDMPRSDT